MLEREDEANERIQQLQEKDEENKQIMMDNEELLQKLESLAQEK